MKARAGRLSPAARKGRQPLPGSEGFECALSAAASAHEDPVLIDTRNGATRVTRLREPRVTKGVR
jgi:hypothetical protein